MKIKRWTQGLTARLNENKSTVFITQMSRWEQILQGKHTPKCRAWRQPETTLVVKWQRWVHISDTAGPEHYKSPPLALNLVLNILICHVSNILRKRPFLSDLKYTTIASPFYYLTYTVCFHQSHFSYYSILKLIYVYKGKFITWMVL